MNLSLSDFLIFIILLYVLNAPEKVGSHFGKAYKAFQIEIEETK